MPWIDCLKNSSGHGQRVYELDQGAKYRIDGSLLWQLANHDVVRFNGARIFTTTDIDAWLIDFNPSATPGNWNESVANQVTRCAATVLIGNRIELGYIYYDDGADGIATLRKGVRLMNTRFASIGYGWRQDNFAHGFEFGGADSLEITNAEFRRHRYIELHELNWGPEVTGGTFDLVRGSTTVTAHGIDANDFTTYGVTKLRFGTDPRLYTIASVTNSSTFELTEGYGIMKGTVSGTGAYDGGSNTTVMTCSDGSADFGRALHTGLPLQAGDTVRFGTDTTDYTVTAVTCTRSTNTFSITVSGNVPVQAGNIPWYYYPSQTGVGAWEQENGASKFAANATLTNVRHLGVSSTEYFLQWEGYYSNVTLIGCNAAGSGTKATFYFSNASNAAGGPISLVIQNFYQEQAGTNNVLWMHDVSNSPFASVSINGGHFGLATSTALRLENINNCDLGASFPGFIDIDRFCFVSFNPNAYVPLSTAFKFRCSRQRITFAPGTRQYFPASNATNLQSFAVPGYDNGTFSTGNATLQYTDIVPSHFRPLVGGLMPKRYQFHLQASDTASATTPAARVTLAPNSTTVSGAFNRAKTLRIGSITNTQARGQDFWVNAEDDGSIYVDQIASGAGTMTISLTLLAVEW